MSYINSHSRTMSASKSSLMQPMGRIALLQGVYLGYVKSADDVQKNGRLRVWVAELGSSPENEDGWIIVNYCSPFAGATNLDTTNVSDVSRFDGTQTSYGMWMIPPDINNQVIVMFLNGDPSRGIWMGSLYNQYMNNMVPAIAASSNNHQFHGKTIPVAEYNKNTPICATNPDTIKKPYEATKFKGVSNQGLIKDKRRGITSSSARRESPSQVFGILTPGPVIDKNNTVPAKIRRKGGSSFVMDDAESSEYIQLATKSGAQININESNGFVYLINRDGTAWVQMDQKGNIEIFGAKNISMRAQRDFNIRADRNINIEAGQNIFMKAAKDTTEGTVPFTYDVNNVPKDSNIPVWNIVGEGKGDGGNIVMHALNNWHSTTQKNAFLTVVDNSMDLQIGGSLNVTTLNGGQEFNSKHGIKLTANAAVDIVGIGNIRVGSNGLLSVVGANGVILCSSADVSINATGNLIETAGGAVSIDGTGVNVGTSVNINGNLDVSAVISNVIDTKTIHSNTVCYNNSPLGGGTSATPTFTDTSQPAVSEGAMSASAARPAEIKPLNDKLNILATWADTVPPTNWRVFSITEIYAIKDVVRYDDPNGNPVYYSSLIVQGPSQFIPANWELINIPTDSKFKRNSLAVRTIVSGFPTYEPCPEHEAFSASDVSGATPTITEDDKSYSGSGGAGNNTSEQPPAKTNPGSNNKDVAGDSATDAILDSSIPMNALKCQLSIHEGVKNKSYADTKGLTTGGIGHLMRANELSQYPVGTTISTEQIDKWYTQDVSSATKIAMSLIGDTWGDLSNIRKRAMIDLAYNLGSGGLAKFINFLSAMKSKNFNKAGQELSTSAWYRQVGNRGPKIIAMITNDIDPNGCDKRYPE